MHIPYYMTYTKHLKSGMAIDGALAVSLYRMQDNTITVSPTNKNADIRPLELLGFEDTFRPVLKSK